MGGWIGGKPYFKDVVKTADETVNNSNVLQDDDELEFYMEANSFYYFELILYLYTWAASDWKMKWDGPAGIAGYTKSDDENYQVATPNSAAKVITSAGDGYGLLHLKAYMWTAAAAGIIKLQWAQNTAVAENTVVKAGSFLRYRKIA
jgi:hypothetical protein